MATSEACGDRIAPREVTVRPVRDARERRCWDALASEFHYLPFNGLFGQCLRHVAVRGETWVALVGWTAGAFKVGVRDAWIGWTRERQFRRLKLIANNSRFVVLGGKGATRNLAALSNAAISIVRMRGEFKYIPPANRHYAARPQDALDAILTAGRP